MHAHYVNGEKSGDASNPVRHRTVDSSKIEVISDGTKPFEFKISEKGCVLYPITIKWHPTAAMPDTQGIPAGMMLEIDPSSPIVVSELPHIVRPSRTSVNGDVTQWLGGVPAAPAPMILSKGKKRARDEDLDHEADIRPTRTRRVRIVTNNPDLDDQGSTTDHEVPPPLRRSTRIMTHKNAQDGSNIGKTKMKEEVDVGVGGSKSKGKLRLRK